jgi:hypothetical protein
MLSDGSNGVVEHLAASLSGKLATEWVGEGDGSGRLWECAPSTSPWPARRTRYIRGFRQRRTAFALLSETGEAVPSRAAGASTSARWREPRRSRKALSSGVGCSLV